VVTLKNVSDAELNINAEEISERFVRGDVSRNTEGSGLGLAIVKSFVELQGGKLQILADGDLFKVIIEWKINKILKTEKMD
jgi:signal transduction histidine kinase